MRFYRGDKKVASKSVTVKGRDGAASGSFVLGYTARKAGHITVRASHRATAELATLKAKGQGVDVLPLRAAPGSKGLAVRILQTKLKALGYVIGQKGVYDARTARAVLAFRKVTGHGADRDGQRRRLPQARPRRRRATRCASRSRATTSRPTCRCRCWR